MQHDDLDLCGRIGVTIAALVFLVEARAQLFGVIGFRKRNLDRMMLALVTHLGLALDRDCAVTELAAQRRPPLRLELGVYRRDFGEIVRVEPHDKCLRGIEPRISQQHANCREIARLRRDDHSRNLQCARKFDAVQRPAAAVAEQREVARIVAARD